MFPAVSESFMHFFHALSVPGTGQTNQSEALLDLMLTNMEEIMKKVKIRGSLG